MVPGSRDIERKKRMMSEKNRGVFLKLGKNSLRTQSELAHNLLKLCVLCARM